MTDTQKEMLQLYSEQDASGKELIFNMLLCAVVCGEPFTRKCKNFWSKARKRKCGKLSRDGQRPPKPKRGAVHNGS